MQVSHIGSFPPFEVEIVLIREFWDLLDAGGDVGTSGSRMGRGLRMPAQVTLIRRRKYDPLECNEPAAKDYKGLTIVRLCHDHDGR